MKVAWDDTERLRDEIRGLRDEIRKRDMISIFRDLGMILLTIGLFLVAFSFSLRQVASEPETKDLLLKGQVSGGFLIFSGIFLFLGSIGDLPSGGLFRAPVERRMEWWFLFFVGLGIILAVMSVLNMQ